MSEELAVYQAGFIAPVVSVQNALVAYQAKKDLIEKIFQKGVDFGEIPGTKKDTLLKAGAEKATSFFGLTPKFTDAEVVNDWTGESHGGEPFFFYRRTCSLYKGDHLIVAVDGSCNSWEKKYRYRGGERVCPECGKPAIKKSKFAPRNKSLGTAPGFYCFDKAGGCGAEFGANDPAIVNQELGQIKNPDVADLVNTILKMADKRALVAATLIATGLSEYFTQDIEDFVRDSDFIDVHVSDITPETPAQSLQGVNTKPASAAVPRKTEPAPNPMTLEEARARLTPGGKTYEDLTVEQLTQVMLTAKLEDSKRAAQLVLDWRNTQLSPDALGDALRTGGVNLMLD